MRIGITGAAGFIGSAVVDRIAGGALGKPLALRLLDLRQPTHPAATLALAGSFADPDVRAALIGDGLDILFHIASMPGGAAEADFAGGRDVNLMASLALFDAVADRGTRVVYTSTIAALALGDTVADADTPLRPGTSYGAHKAMCELYLADLTRRGALDGRSVRPAGIVSRPEAAYAGFATAWLSDIFRAIPAGRDFAVPVPASAALWFQSVGVVADNIVHAAAMPAVGLPRHRAWTLPATVAPIGELAAALARATGSRSRVTFGERPFTQPPLDASDALQIGFTSDGDIDGLVANVLAQLAGEKP